MYKLLTEEERAKLQIISLDKNQLLFRENEICNSTAIVIDGRIEIKSYDINGKEIIYNTIYGGGIFANNLLFSQDKRYKGNAVALEKSHVVLLNEKELLNILQNNQDFLLRYLHIQADYVKRLNLNLKLLSYDSARERFLYYLEYHDGLIIYKTITSLAKELFISRERLSRLISELCKEKMIIKEKQLIKLVD